MSRITAVIFFTIFPILFTACFREDYGNCPSGLYVCFEPNNPAHKYPDLVRTVDLYFYDGNGQLYGSYNYQREDLRPGDMAAFVPDIDAGAYRVVAVVNGVEDYETAGSDNYRTLRTQVKKELSETELIDFFTAEKQITVGGSPTAIATETMAVGKHNNEIELYILYDGYDLPQGVDITAYISGNNGDLEYHRYMSGDGTFRTYLPHVGEHDDDGKPKRADISTFRLWIGSDVTLFLTEVSDDPGYNPRSVTLNITEELAKVRDDSGRYLYDTDEKLEYYDRYEIALTLSKDMTVIALSINDWDTVGGGVEV